MVYINNLNSQEKCIAVNIDFGGGESVEYTLTTATWFWLLIPMPLLVVLSIITFFTERRE
jgi:hypothetical protein